MDLRLLLSCYEEADRKAAQCYAEGLAGGLAPSRAQALASKCYSNHWHYLVAFYTPPVGAKN